MSIVPIRVARYRRARGDGVMARGWARQNLSLPKSVAAQTADTTRQRTFRVRKGSEEQNDIIMCGHPPPLPLLDPSSPRHPTLARWIGPS